MCVTLPIKHQRFLPPTTIVVEPLLSPPFTLRNHISTFQETEIGHK
jgi:hypothetical protein